MGTEWGGASSQTSLASERKRTKSEKLNLKSARQRLLGTNNPAAVPCKKARGGKLGAARTDPAEKD